MLVHNLGSCPDEIQNWPWNTEGKERSKKEADPSGLVGGRYNKRGNLDTRLVWAAASISQHPPTRILRVYVEALTGSLTYTVQMVSITHHFSRLQPWSGSQWQQVECTFNKKRVSDCLDPTWQSPGSHILWMTFSNRLISKIYKEEIQCNSKKKKMQMIWFLKWEEDLNKQFPKENIQVVNRYMKRCSTLLIAKKMLGDSHL